MQRLNHLWSLGFSSATHAPSLSRYYLSQFRQLASVNNVEIRDQTAAEVCFRCTSVHVFGSNASIRHLPAKRKSGMILLQSRIHCKECDSKQTHCVRLTVPREETQKKKQKAEEAKRKQGDATRPQLPVFITPQHKKQESAKSLAQKPTPESSRQQKRGNDAKKNESKPNNAKPSPGSGKLGNYLASMGIKM